MSVQYPGGRAAILGVIHRHRLGTSFNFTPEIYSKIEPQKAQLMIYTKHNKLSASYTKVSSLHVGIQCCIHPTVAGKANRVHHLGQIMERQVRSIALEQSLFPLMGKVDNKSATQSSIALLTDKWRI